MQRYKIVYLFCLKIGTSNFKTQFGLSAEPGTKKAKKNINWREAVHDALDIAGSITG